MHPSTKPSAARAPARLALSLFAALALAGCHDGTNEPDTTPKREPLRGDVIDLGRNAAFAALSVPPDSRPDGTLPPERIVIDGPWTRSETADAIWRTELPIRLRSKASSRPPRGMKLYDDSGTRVPHAFERVRAKMIWAIDDEALAVRTIDAPGPPGRVELEYPRAARRERSLNLRFSGMDDEERFVRRTLRVGAVSRSGLLLSAPASASWHLVVPPDASVSFAPQLVPPEVRDAPASDGVTFELSVDDGTTRETLFSRRLKSAGAASEETTIDLSAWSGREVTLTISTSPGSSATFDYAFVADPVVVTNEDDPRRVVLVFADTLRPDHLGLHGYERDTSPFLDRFAEAAVVFDEARSVAPWTLPATKSVITGRHPEEYAPGATLAARLARRGWATAFFAGSVVVSSSYGMHAGWSHHELRHLADGAEQVDRALAWLDDHRDRDALVMVHFMDPHLPYREPEPYRTIYAGEAPPSLGETFDRIDVRRLNPTDPETRAYVVDRYDNNVRYLDDQIARLVETLDDEDVVVVFADHGEEFWDHGGFEHGHTLYDELLRVPLMIRAAGRLEPRRVRAPVSLLDVTPTLLELLDIDAPPLDGSSLLPLAHGDADAERAFETRPQVFGRPLYGPVQWGLLERARKYVTRGAEEMAFDLDEDPDETRNLLEHRGWAAGAPSRARIADVLGRDVRLGFVLQARATRPAPAPVTATLAVPGGVGDAFVAHEPTLPSGAEVAVDDEGATARWERGFRRGHQVLVSSDDPLPSIEDPLRLVVRHGGSTRAIEVPVTEGSAAGLDRGALGEFMLGPGLGLRLGHAVFVLPLDSNERASGFDEEAEEALRSLGYVGDDE